VTGWHANYQLIDDPNKPEELTPVNLQGVKDWLARTLDTRWRRPPQVNSLVCIMQRLHCDDLAQTLIDRGAMHICLPATFDPTRRTVTKYGSDPRLTRGELLDPVRLPRELVDHLRKNLGPINAAAQLDQNPVPEGGAVFKREHLQFWSTDPKACAEGIFVPGVSAEGQKFRCIERPKSFDQAINSWDCAFKDEATSDYVAGQVWGRSASNMFLLDQMHDQMDFPATVMSVLALRTRWKGASAIVIEDKANGPAVIATLKNSVPGIIEVNPEGGKYSRASSASAFFEARNVFVPDPNMPGYGWVFDYLTELLTFPRAKHDDQVDATTQALIYLLKNTSYLREAMEKVRKIMGYVQT
jgi:predicted phage terminase large subunit-like protein